MVQKQSYTLQKILSSCLFFPGSPAEPTEEEQKEEELRLDLKTFWKDLLPLLQRLPDTSSLHNVARLDYEVKSLMVPTDPSEAEQKVNMSKVTNSFKSKRL